MSLSELFVLTVTYFSISPLSNNDYVGDFFFFFDNSSDFLEGVGKEDFEVWFVLFIPYVIYNFVGLSLETLSCLASFHTQFCLSE